MSFPKWKYHPDKEPVEVGDVVQEAMLGGEWEDGPPPAPPKRPYNRKKAE